MAQRSTRLPNPSKACKEAGHFESVAVKCLDEIEELLRFVGNENGKTQGSGEINSSSSSSRKRRKTASQLIPFGGLFAVRLRVKQVTFWNFNYSHPVLCCAGTHKDIFSHTFIIIFFFGGGACRSANGLQSLSEGYLVARPCGRWSPSVTALIRAASRRAPSLSFKLWESLPRKQAALMWELNILMTRRLCCLSSKIYPSPFLPSSCVEDSSSLLKFWQTP